jgi:hypothetical protein
MLIGSTVWFGWTAPLRAQSLDAENISEIIRAGIMWRREELARTTPRETDAKEWAAFKLKAMHDIDQWSRAWVMFALRGVTDEAARKHAEKILLPVLQESDRKNVEDLKSMIARHGWFTISEFGPEADTNAWIIVQHATFDLPFMKSVLAVLEPLAKTGESSPSSFAYLHDRIAVNEGRPQTYGTQGTCEGGTWIANPIDAPEQLEARRNEMGLGPFEDYRHTVNRMCR